MDRAMSRAATARSLASVNRACLTVMLASNCGRATVSRGARLLARHSSSTCASGSAALASKERFESRDARRSSRISRLVATNVGAFVDARSSVSATSRRS